MPQRIDAGAAGGYLWLGSMGGLIAYTLWFRGIGQLPVGASAPLVLLSPLVATAIGVVLGESLSLLQTLGFVLALAALLAAQLGPPRRPGRIARGRQAGERENTAGTAAEAAARRTRGEETRPEERRCEKP